MERRPIRIATVFKPRATCISVEKKYIPCYQTVTEVSVTFEIGVHGSSCMQQFDEFLIDFLVKNRDELAGVWLAKLVVYRR